ncbi:unnamed protein product [Peronospora belbahrii]|uniref:Amino acid transporter n=1 Tax=Peronospora belbahrii TaxID=622444 RepID=A0AAU9KLY6_9STRA|nr:unnamed protein product [Peronospora belbahrii]
MVDTAPQSRRALSRESYASISRTSTFADFLSDSSGDEDEDDAHSRATLRMQQETDDWVFEDSMDEEMPLTHHDLNRSSNRSFRLSMAKPGFFDTNGDCENGSSGPKTIVEQVMASKDVKSPFEGAVENKTFGHTRQTFGVGKSDRGTNAAAAAAESRTDCYDSFASSPPRFSANDDSFFGEAKPSFSDEHSLTGDDSFMTIDTSFVYRPSVLDDDDDVEVPSKEMRLSHHCLANRLSLSNGSIGTSTNNHVNTTTGAGTHGNGDRPVQGAADTNVDHANATVATTFLRHVKPIVSRQSSAASSLRSSHDFSSQQRRTAASHESCRISSLDLWESKHTFDEERGPSIGQARSSRASAQSEQQSHRLSSAFEERHSMMSTSSNSSSFISFHDQPSFFVDDVQQNVPSRNSPSLDSRSSLANFAILGDDARDPSERRSSDIIPQDIGEYRCSSALDHSYSDLVDVAAGVDHIVSSEVNRERFDAVDRNYSGANVSSNGTSLGSSLLALSAVSQSSAASGELSFLSFSAVKPTTSTGPSKQQTQRESVKQSPLITAMGNSDRQNATYEVDQVLYRSIALPRGSNVKRAKPSRSSSVTSSTYSTSATNFSSAALLAAIKTRDVRTDTRVEDSEASDVALGTLPQLAPPLKITRARRSQGSRSSSLLSNSSAGSSPSIIAPPSAISSKTGLSVASLTSSGDRLDFTGVYRGSINSGKSSGTNDVSSRPIRSDGETTQLRSQQRSLGERKNTNEFDCLSVKLERSKSDGRAMQREARRKVENFFRDTRQRSVYDIDEQEVHRATNQKTRARTTVMMQCVDNVAAGRRSFASHSINVAKVIDLKNLRNGGKRIGSHLEYYAVPVTPQQEEESAKRRAMRITTGTSSKGVTATRSDHIPIRQNYTENSPQTRDVETKMHAQNNMHAQKFKTAANTGERERREFLSGPLGPKGDDFSRSRTPSGRRADNVSLILAQSGLSAVESPAFSPSPFATSFATPNTLGRSGDAGFGSSSGKSPAVFTSNSRRQLWKSGSSFSDLNEEAADTQFDASRLLSQRFQFVDRVQTISASLASSVQRFLHGKTYHRHNGNVDLTSPRSQCTAPTALPRAYNHNGFYEIPFKVPDLNKPLLQREKQHLVESNRDWVRQWLILVACVVLGLSIGTILVRIAPLNARIFSLPATEVHERQESNGELVFSGGVQWFLLPGRLFVRVWSALGIPLLICYIVNALSDLVGCADKAALVLSFRSVGYAMVLAMLATFEGVLAMWMTHKFGWFRGSSSTARSEASMLTDAIGVTPLTEGAVGLLCSGDSDYLRRLGDDVFSCSNTSLLLPLYKEVSNNSVDISDSGPAVFGLQAVTRVFATPTSTMAYYPVSLGTGGNMVTLLLLALTPDTVAVRYTEVASNGIAPLGVLVVFALFLGSLCGKRILRLRRDAQAAMFESVATNDSADVPHNARHYIVGILMELQFALEWLVRPMERYLAPVGFFSLMLGNVVAHHREWRSFTSPMSSLIVGVLILFILHATVVLPMVLKQLSSGRHRLPLLTTMRSFIPAFMFAFTTDNVALSAPVVMQCYARVLTVTRSAAQAATAVTAAVTRSARALYLPLALLWLLETSSSEELELNASDYMSIGIVSMLSCFCGGSTRLTLAMVRTLWSTQSSNPASSLPATMPLLVVCDAVLSRFASVVTLVDHVVLTHLAAQHWGEMVVQGKPSRLSNSNISSVSPLNDSQVPRPPSSAMMSSVCL